jgi:hypothetical protein
LGLQIATELLEYTTAGGCNPDLSAQTVFGANVKKVKPMGNDAFCETVYVSYGGNAP